MNVQRYNSMLKTCENQALCNPAQPIKANSAGNDPTISKAMRYSQYVRSTRKKIITQVTPLPTPPTLPFVFTQIITRNHGVGFISPNPPPST